MDTPYTLAEPDLELRPQASLSRFDAQQGDNENPSVDQEQDRHRISLMKGRYLTRDVHLMPETGTDLCQSLNGG